MEVGRTSNGRQTKVGQTSNASPIDVGQKSEERPTDVGWKSDEQSSAATARMAGGGAALQLLATQRCGEAGRALQLAAMAKISTLLVGKNVTRKLPPLPTQAPLGSSNTNTLRLRQQ
jgi:hypothetical protein